MGSYYEKYLDRIIKERKERPFQDMASLQVQQIAPQMQKTRRDIKDTMNREGGSALAKARFAMDAEGQIIDQVGNIYNEAQIKEIARQEQLRGEQSKAQLLVDQEKEAKKKAEKARTQQIWKTAAEMVGTVGGTIATGGNIAAGMAIGKAAGGVVDVATGLDKSYDSPESIVQGGASILSGVISTVDTLAQENFIEDMKPILEKIPDMTEQEFMQFKLEYENALNGIGRKEFIEYWNKWGE